MQERRIAPTKNDIASRPVDKANGGELMLADIWTGVRKRWLWCCAGVLAGGLLAFTYAMLASPRYESHASVQVGKVQELGLIEDMDALAIRLLSQYGRGADVAARERLPYLRQASKVPGNNNVLRLATIGRSPEEAKKFLDDISKTVTDQHDELYEGTLNPVRQRLAAIDSQISQLTVQATELGILIARLRDTQPVQASLVAMDRSRIYQQLGDLQRDRLLLQQRTTRLSSSPSRVIVPAGLEESPASPKTALLVVLGGVLGLLLALLVASLSGR